MAETAGVDRLSPLILLADDSVDTQDLVTVLLQGQGYTVEGVTDGVAALESIRRRRPDLILTDVMMPRLDGVELLRSLRADAQTRELPIILLSARSGEDARIEGLAAGADAYLTKPFSPRELLVRIETCLKLAQIRRESAQREYHLRTLAEAAQQAAEAAAARLTRILESMGDAFIALDRDWRITYQNAASEQINGQPRSAVLGHTCWQVWPGLVGSELEVLYRRAMAQQRAMGLEHHYVEPPHHDLWLEVQAYPTPEGLNIFYRDITERKRLEAERKQIEASLQDQRVQLQQQLAEIETIYQSAPIGLNVLDRELRFVRVNERLAEINGLSVEAHLGRTVQELLPDLAAQAEATLRPILETGEPLLNIEISGETPAQPGVQRTWVESFWPLKDGDRVIGISTVCQEITERKRMEAERQQALQALHQAKAELEQRVAERTADLQQMNADLRQRKSVLRSFFNSAAMPMGIVELHDNDILHISDNWAAADFLGTTPTAMENRFASELGVSAATIQHWMTYYREAERTQTPARFEYCHGRVEGARWLSGSVCPIANSPSGYPRFSYIIEDITERKQAEATLAHREEQLRLTFEFTHIGTWDWDVGQNRVAWNDNHFKLLGLEASTTEDTYQRWRCAVHPDDLERVEQALQTALHQHTDYEAEYRVILGDGTVRWLLGKGRGLYDSDQNPVRMLGVIIDISDRKESQEKLRASLKEKELLLKEIYHRVKNNLQVIHSLLNLQSRNVADAAALSVLRDSQSRVKAMALVHEKLYKSQDLTRIDLAAYVQRLAYSLLETYQCDKNRIQIHLDIAPCHLDIETALPCGLMLTELISNSFKYAFPQGRTGEVAIVSRLSPDGQVTIRLEDNGVGLPEEMDLQQVSSLGLSLVRNLTQQIGGRVEIMPQSVGTGFQISFPT
ncbi:PAS domain S-box protein [Leptolyngbya sp. KIOST-1]|uniref:PAS domain S-box protein n=1 Tax=Leptolyngbya sp. KIOST-1 TaxID=1229172 RepID=UPI00068D02CA|nr:PAS domain S-box protein [Leptolyngbya sp. KIOST-1]